MQETEVAICLCGDDRAAYGITVSAHSALSCLKKSANLYFLDYGFSDESKALIWKTLGSHRRLHSLQILSPEKTLFSGISSNRFPAAAMGRLQLAELVNERLALYLDYDTLVTRDVTELFHNFRSEHLFAAARDSWIPLFDDLNKPSNAKSSKYSNRPYFNSGVMLLNLDRWRRDGVNAFLQEWLAANHQEYEFPYADQCFLNYALYDRWQELPSTWNWMMRLSEEDLEFGPLIPAILHFPGKYKPWNFIRDQTSGVVRKYHLHRERIGLNAHDQASLSQPAFSASEYIRHIVKISRYRRSLKNKSLLKTT